MTFEKTSLMKLSLVLTLLLGISTTVQANDWPQWRGPNRDGRSTETLVNTNWKKNPPKHLWTTEGFGSGYASVSIVKGKLYTTGNFNNSQSVIAADAATGKIIWTKALTQGAPKHGYDGSRCTPSIDGDLAYVVTSDGEIVCLETSNGNIKWKKDFKQSWNGKMMSGWGFSESPLVDGNNVLCTPGGQNAMIVCLDKKTGKEVWKASMPSVELEKGKNGAGYSSIVVSNAAGVKQYVQMMGRGLISVRASDGKFLWGYNKVANPTANIPTPIPVGNYVFASTGYGTGACLVEVKKKGRNGVGIDEKYFLTAKTFQNHHGGMVEKDGWIYAGHQHNKGFPTCLNMKSGKIKWGGKMRGPGKGSAAIVMVDDHLIFRYQDGTVALIEATPQKYNLKGTFRPDFQQGKTWAHPVVVDGKLYLREQDKLMCYDLSS